MMFFGVKGLVCNAQNVFNAAPVARVLGDADADGKARCFDIFREPLGNTLSHTTGILGGGSGQNESELIAPIPGRRIDGPAT